MVFRLNQRSRTTLSYCGPVRGGLVLCRPIESTAFTRRYARTYGVLSAVHITWATVKIHALAESRNLVVTEFLAQR
jgi:hypothetical protein